MENEFLHRINVDALKKELKMDVPSIAKLAGISENGVYKWAWAKESHGARPPFNAIIKLLRAGASTETLFGVSSKPQQPASVLPPEFVEGFREQLMEDFMKKGLVPEEKVKEIVRQEIERLLPSAKPVNKF
ncbi:MAG: hypothetical protein IJ982_01140 [Fibrobacter sp.]|nr:hypothetical protein [Fibrobacter sp.]